jgi:chaperonin GroEL (HSP60 family)
MVRPLQYTISMQLYDCRLICHRRRLILTSYLVMAVQSIANIVKSSLGPVGLDKMLVDERGDVVMTNDGATILSLLDVSHPAGKMLVELATQQDKEVGDGTTSVVLLAAELLKQANELVKLKVHPTTYAYARYKFRYLCHSCL